MTRTCSQQTLRTLGLTYTAHSAYTRSSTMVESTRICNSVAYVLQYTLQRGGLFNPRLRCNSFIRVLQKQCFCFCTVAVCNIDLGVTDFDHQGRKVLDNLTEKPYNLPH